MTHFLALASSYTDIELALFQATDSQQPQLRQQISINKHDASRLMITSLDAILKKHQLKIADISFAAVNQGPAPFTTLRVLITTMNAIHYATQLPLIGIDALQASLDEYRSATCPITVVLLNAFHGDVYFGVEQQSVVKTGYAQAASFLPQLALEHPHSSIYFVGNGVELYRSQIQELFGQHAVIPEPLPLYCSITTIGHLGYAQWVAGMRGGYVYPKYLKNIS